MKEIEQVVARIAKIPERSVSSTEAEKLKDLEEELKARIFGQDEAIDDGHQAIKRSRAGFRAPDKPVAPSCSSAPPASARPSWPASSPPSWASPCTAST